MRKLMTDKIHQSHQGIEKSKRLVRDRPIFYWPGMANQIQDIIEKCDICNRYKNNNPKEPTGMKGTAKPSLPWQKIATDLFQLGSEYYIVLVD